MKEYAVTITETLKMTVHVEAKNSKDAEIVAERNWRNSEYILDADSFTGVEFKAKPPIREQDMER